MFRLLALLALVAASLSACVVVPVPARRVYVEPPPPVVVVPYPRHRYGGRWSRAIADCYVAVAPRVRGALKARSMAHRPRANVNRASATATGFASSAT